MNHFNLKRFLLLLSTICLFTPLSKGEETKVWDTHINGYKYKVNGLWYSLVTGGAGLSEGPYTKTISEYDGEQYSGDIVVPEKVTINGDEKNVVSISGYFYAAAKAVKSVTITGNTKINTFAFQNCPVLEYVILSKETTSIPEEAFRNSPVLKRISYSGGPTGDGLHLPSTVTSIGKNAFNSCKVLLQEYSLPTQITSLGLGAFSNCESLTKFTFPAGTKITKIPDRLFEGCTNLKSISYSTNFTSIGNYAFANCTSFYAGSSFSLPKGLTSLGTGAFNKCGVKEVDFENTSLTAIPESAFADCANLTAISSLPSTLKSIGKSAFANCTSFIGGGSSKIHIIPLSVTTIGESAYTGCTALQKITIQQNVTTIGKEAFNGCKSLTSINFSERKIDFSENKDTSSPLSIGSKAFTGCTALEKLILPNTTKDLLTEAFSECSSLKEISFTYPQKPTTLTVIGEKAFYKCTALTKVLFPEGINTIGKSAFDNCTALLRLEFPESLALIGARAFAYCTGLIDVSAYDVRIIKLDPSAFENAGITKWDIRNRTTTEVSTSRSGTPSKGLILAHSAFRYCKNLEKLPDNVISFDESALEGCAGLKTAYIPSGASEIANNTFYGCVNLTDVTLPETVRSIGNYSFYNCANLTNIKLSDSIRSIGDYAFYQCSNLKNITIPDSVKSIGQSTFERCSNLTSVTFPDSISEIKREAFYYCSNLQSISFGTKEWDSETEDERVLNIITRAFYSCSKISYITIYFKTPPTLSASCFSASIYKSATLSVPYGCLEAYRNANYWSQFKNIVERAPLSSITPIDTDNNNNMESTIFSTDGRLIFRGNMTDAADKLPQGIYIVRTGSKTQKIIVP